MISAIRVRGSSGIQEGVKRELSSMGLEKVNSCALLPDNDSTRGRLQRVKDYVTWGDLDEEGAKLLLERADVSNRKDLTTDNLEEVTGYDSMDDLASDLAEGEVSLKDAGIKHVVRLHSPRRGFEDKKRTYPEGCLGDRDEDVNDLIRRMR